MDRRGKIRRHIKTLVGRRIRGKQKTRQGVIGTEVYRKEGMLGRDTKRTCLNCDACMFQPRQVTAYPTLTLLTGKLKTRSPQPNPNVAPAVRLKHSRDRELDSNS